MKCAGICVSRLKAWIYNETSKFFPSSFVIPLIVLEGKKLCQIYKTIAGCLGTTYIGRSAWPVSPSLCALLQLVKHDSS